MSARRASLPSFIVIGAQKCGTTSLHYYLGLHPDIGMSRPKELDFFLEDGNWRRGLDWYTSRFPRGKRVLGETSPNYTNHPTDGGVPERMASVIPDARLIYLVRDPIERIVSHYVHRHAAHQEDRSLDEALASLEGNPYLDRSRYFMQLERYLAWFDPSRIRIVTSEELRSDRVPVLQQCFRFLGVDDGFASARFGRIINATGDQRRKTRLGRGLELGFAARLGRWVPAVVFWRARRLFYRPFSRPIERPAVSPELRARLRDTLEPDIDRLRKHAGRRFERWSV